METGTWLGGGGGWEWTPLDTRITYGQFFKSSGINLEYLTPQVVWSIDPSLIILPARWGCAAKKYVNNYYLNLACLFT